LTYSNTPGLRSLTAKLDRDGNGTNYGYDDPIVPNYEITYN
jgi:hypothetical protein